MHSAARRGMQNGPSKPPESHEKEQEQRERNELLVRLSSSLDQPMALLGFVWLVLVVIDLARGLPPFLSALNTAIWALFALHFVVEFVVAPHKLSYFRRNWLTALALVLPALRTVRVLRALRAARMLRAARGARLLRVVSSANRGMRALGRVMGRRGLGYVVALTAIVNLLGAAGIYAFEREVRGGGITEFGTALWWTAMTLTTMGSDYFPRTGEGRLLGLLLAIYGFAIFGYVTASIASFFVARDAEDDEGELAGSAQIEALRGEVASLSARVAALLDAGERPPGSSAAPERS
jgi:voltage-gated potassium channel